MYLIPILILGASFILGTVVGSFLNVCIYRIPAGMSIVHPRSRCPRCEKQIPWHQNVPIISYVMLAGRCGNCRARISLRYPAVEFLTGLLFIFTLWSFGVHLSTLVYWVFCAVLIVITFIDLDHQLIPDVISLPGIVVGFLGSFLVPWVTWLDSLLGVLLGGGSLLLIALGYEKMTGKEGMGGGDIKLLAMIGAFLGWTAILPILLISSLLGTAIGVPVMLLKGKDGKLAIPFGPFLAIGSLIYLFWGRSILSWYLNLFTP